MQKSVLAVIMGGGRGTRLFPLTSERCKPAVPLAGKCRLVDIPISNCINSGVNRIFLLTQFHTASLHRHIQNTYHFDAFGGGFVDILSAEQTEKTSDWYQGTADAVRRNLQHMKALKHDYVLILSGDQLYKMDFEKVIAEHQASGADVTIAAKPIPVDGVEGLGLMRVDDSLRISAFVEKPTDPVIIDSLAVSEKVQAGLQANNDKKHCLASMGIYVFNRDVLMSSLENSMTDFGKEVIPSLLTTKKLHAHVFEGYWEDIGTVRAFFEANLGLAQPLPPFNFYDPDAPIYTLDAYLPASKINRCSINHAVIGDGAIVTDSTLTRVVIGPRSYLGENSNFEDVIMMGADCYETQEMRNDNRAAGLPSFGVGHNCRIRFSIIDKNTRIGDDVILDPAGLSDGTYGEGIVIRDGVLIVPKGIVVASGTKVCA